MADWARCFFVEGIPELGGRVVPFEIISPDVVEVLYKGKSYDIPLDKIQRIEPPKFTYGDPVSPANHPEIVGIISDMIYHGEKKASMYFIEIDGKKKSKRYFDDDLIRR